jgi:hypothetical protein
MFLVTTQADTMKILAVALILLVAGFEQSRGQHVETPVAQGDTLHVPLGLGLAANPERPLFVLPPILLNDFSFGSPGFISGIRPPMFPTSGASLVDAKVDLLSPLRLQWARDAKLKPYYSVLGAVQLGGAAYALYRHFRKGDAPSRRNPPAAKNR